MYLEFVKDYQGHKAGDVVFASAGFAELVLAGGFAKPAEKPAEKPEAKPKKRGK